MFLSVVANQMNVSYRLTLTPFDLDLTFHGIFMFSKKIHAVDRIHTTHSNLWKSRAQIFDGIDSYDTELKNADDTHTKPQPHDATDVREKLRDGVLEFFKSQRSLAMFALQTNARQILMQEIFTGVWGRMG